MAFVIDTQTGKTHALDFKKLFILENFMLQDVKVYEAKCMWLPTAKRMDMEFMN
ncbi:MAG TPA: hypothetical protein GXX35_06030 [Thermoanaerobacterales bacterium]|nr:hypothetical protein [Thermoanaerobacterales bacterium]